MEDGKFKSDIEAEFRPCRKTTRAAKQNCKGLALVIAAGGGAETRAPIDLNPECKSSAKDVLECATIVYSRHSPSEGLARRGLKVFLKSEGPKRPGVQFNRHLEFKA